MVKIIYEDDSIIVINKPAGLATQSANIASKDCVSVLKKHISDTQNIKAEPYLGIIHRLDQPVAGILVFAKNQKAAAKLSAQVGGVGMNKTYRALVEGNLPLNETSTLTNMMYKDPKEKKGIVVKKVGRKDVKLQEAVLDYKVLQINEKNNTSLLEIELKTGRFHQIRAQLSAIGHPIAGDKKYGSTIECPNDFIEEGTAPRGAIALQACELIFKHPDSGKVMNFKV